jgi:hypothetical protein
MLAKFDGLCPYCENEIVARCHSIAKGSKGWGHSACIKEKDLFRGMSGEDQIAIRTTMSAYDDFKKGLISESDLIDIERRYDDY